MSDTYAFRPRCEYCGEAWSDAMIVTFEHGLMGGCSCCHGSGAAVSNIVCHACNKVLLWTADSPPPDKAQTSDGSR